MSFQQSVTVNPGIGVPGDFASTNPRRFLVSGAADQRMVASVNGVTIGRFAILGADGVVDSTPAFADVTPANLGFVHRVIGNAAIYPWLAETSMVIPSSRGVELFANGDFFAVADAVTGTPVRGAKVIWEPAAGSIDIGATASAYTVDTGFILLSDSAVAGQTVIIGKP